MNFYSMTNVGRLRSVDNIGRLRSVAKHGMKGRDVPLSETGLSCDSNTMDEGDTVYRLL